MSTSNRRVNLAHFTMRQIMEMEACTRCGECIKACPTFTEAENEEIHPLNKIARAKSFWKADHLGLLARLFGIRPATGETLAAFGQGTFKCTLCARCHVVCPIQIDTRPLWIAMREQLVEWGLYPETFDMLRDRVMAQHNISGDDNSNRLIWTQNLDHVPEGLDRKAGAETVYFMGCVGAMYPRVYSVPQSLAQILEWAGESFTTLGGEEWCCGFPLEIAGMGQHAHALARHNVESVRTVGARRLVATCPSCYHTWAHEYPRILGEPLGFEVLHATELLADLVDEGKIRLRGFAQAVTYHDPCDLGRTSGIYEAPRRILQAIPGIQFTEMADNREMSLCCGGGGDAEMADAELTAAVAKRRLEQAQATGAAVIVSACQQCDRTLAEAARKNRVRIRVQDITEVVWQAMQD
ncbi:MAG TPA: (Fe-S)-binding protein [Anaerolineae bacterium]|nr:(Fe-S)-binding protein [Anaerolineae bacterium]